MQEKKNVSTNTVSTTDPEEPINPEMDYRKDDRLQTANPLANQLLIRVVLRPSLAIDPLLAAGSR
jgi:hypothetical protein